MNTVYKVLFTAFLCVFAGGYCVFGADDDIIQKSIKVTVGIALPPQARTIGTVGVNSSNSRSQWAQVDVRFRTDDVKSLRRRYLNKPELAVELAIYPNNKEKSVIFSGKVNYWFLEQDGKDHYMKILLPAQFFRRFSDGRSIERVTFVAKAVVSFDGKVRATGYGSTKGLSDKEIALFFRRLPANALRVNGAMMGRMGTPWSIIEVNRYEYEKLPWLADAGTNTAEASSAEQDKNIPARKDADASEKNSRSKKKRTKKNR